MACHEGLMTQPRRTVNSKDLTPSTLKDSEVIYIFMDVPISHEWEFLAIMCPLKYLPSNIWNAFHRGLVRDQRSGLVRQSLWRI